MIAHTEYTQLRKHACYVIKASGKSAHARGQITFPIYPRIKARVPRPSSGAFSSYPQFAEIRISEKSWYM